jgi:hypothetical protein
VAKLDFLGAKAVTPVGEDRAPGVLSYFTGSREQWVTGLGTYRRLVYRDLWPGIDLAYSGTGRHLKYEFVVAPGADPSRIRLAYRGVDDVAVDAGGSLAIRTPLAVFTDVAPESYQTRGGARVRVGSAFHVERTDEGRFTYGFAVEDYDTTRPLVIDPATLVYAGFIGGNLADVGNAVAVDGAGALYVAGQTFSSATTFPATVGPDLTFNGFSDAFVAKVAPNGTLVYAGYIGGSTTEVGRAIAVDGAGAAYVVGETNTINGTFPTTVGPDLTTNGGTDCFVVKVSPGGGALQYAGYIGGGGNDSCTGVAVDSAGAAYVSGDTVSSEASFPVKVGPDLTYNGGTGDAFVAKVNPGGNGLSYAGYIGGAGADRGLAIAVDASGAAYVTGQTGSNEATFPVVVGPDLTFNSGTDAYVAKVDPSGAGLVYAGYIGGLSSERGLGIAVDAAGAAYVTGDTASNQATFPETVGPDLTSNGSLDAFVAKVSPAGTGLVYAGYIGGSGSDTGYGIAVDAAGAAYVTGQTTSSEINFPVLGGPGLTYSGNTDAFVAKVDPSGTGLVYAGYIGGAGSDAAQGIAVDGAGTAYVAGYTSSDEVTFPVTGGPDLTYNGGTSDAFVAKVSFDSSATTTTTSTSSPGSTDTSMTSTSTSTVVTSTSASSTSTSTTSTTSTSRVSTSTSRSSTSTSRASTSSSTTTSTTLPPIDPFLCYRTKVKQPIAVTLADEFDSGSYQGSAAKLFCAPAGVNGQAAQDSLTDLMGHKIKGRHARRSRVRVTNQLATFPFTFDTKKTDSLLVPSVMGPALLPDPGSRVDHYRCLKVAISRGTATFPAGIRVPVADQFASRTVTVKKPTKLCLATARDGAPVKNPDHHLMCYAVKATPRTRAKGVQVSDEFGQAVLGLQGEAELCVPSTIMTPG